MTVVVPISERKECGQNNPFTRISWSMAVGLLLMLLPFGVSLSYFGCGGSGDGAACSDHIPNNVHVLAHLCIPRSVSGCWRRSLRGGWVT